MYRKSALFLVLAWLSGIIGFVLGVSIEATWFARFGSIVVLFAIMSEYVLLHKQLTILYEDLENHDTISEIEVIKPSKWHRKKVWVSHLTVALGTVIWGFGDLLI